MAFNPNSYSYRPYDYSNYHVDHSVSIPTPSSDQARLSPNQSHVGFYQGPPLTPLGFSPLPLPNFSYLAQNHPVQNLGYAQQHSFPPGGYPPAGYAGQATPPSVFINQMPGYNGHINRPPPLAENNSYHSGNYAPAPPSPSSQPARPQTYNASAKPSSPPGLISTFTDILKHTAQNPTKLFKKMLFGAADSALGVHHHKPHNIPASMSGASYSRPSSHSNHVAQFSSSYRSVSSDSMSPPGFITQRECANTVAHYLQQSHKQYQPPQSNSSGNWTAQPLQHYSDDPMTIGMPSWLIQDLKR